MVMRLIILEKRSLVASLVSTGLLSADDQITFTFSLGLWIESQEKLKFNQIPYTGYSRNMRSLHEAISNREPGSWHSKKDLIVDGEGSSILTLNTSTDGLNEMMAFLNEQLPNYSEIIIATDNDRRGAYGALQIIDRLNTPLPSVHVMLFSSTDKINLTKSWNNREKNSWESSGHAKKAKAQKIKRLFEFWWHSNSALVFGEICKKAGLKGDPVISKYEFMIMKILSSHESEIDEGKLLDLMETWPGTGKFTEQNLVDYECKIGSSTSRTDLISRLTARGFARHSNHSGPHPRTLKVTTEGLTFMALCHPKTFDPDLPSRLSLWSRDEDIAAARRYINTVFSRQLRFQRNQPAFMR
jgi:hypothetical protein